jgi:hypothetical protein
MQEQAEAKARARAVELGRDPEEAARFARESVTLPGSGGAVDGSAFRQAKADLAALEADTPEAKVAANKELRDLYFEQYEARLLAMDLTEEEKNQVPEMVARLREAQPELSNFARGWDEIGDSALGAFEGGMQQAFQGFISGTKSASEAFREFAESFISQTLAMIATQATLFAISGGNWGAFAYEKGGIIPGGTGPTKKFAKGGIQKGGFQNPLMMAGGGVVRQKSFAVIGEGNKDEAVVPLPDNRSIPVTFTGGRGGGMGGSGEAGPPQITLNVQVPVQAIDTRDFRARINEVSREIGDAVKKRIGEDPSLLRAMRSGVRR